MLRHLSEEGRRHKDAMSSEIEKVRKIVHKNGSAAEDMAGGQKYPGGRVTGYRKG